MAISLKSVQMLDIVSLPKKEQTALRAMISDGGLGMTDLVNGAAYQLEFDQFFYRSEAGEYVRNTEDYDQVYFDMFDLLLPFVPESTLRGGKFWLYIWW
jgi:hypothetical protein